MSYKKLICTKNQIKFVLLYFVKFGIIKIYKFRIGKTKKIESKKEFYNESENYDSFLFEGGKSRKVFLKGKIITRAYPMYEV